MPKATAAAADVTPRPATVATPDRRRRSASAPPPQDWRAAVRLAGDALVASGATDAGLHRRDDRDRRAAWPVHRHRPGHRARPFAPVAGRSPRWYQPGDPRPNRSTSATATNDPVRLVVGLAAPDEEGHVTALSTLAEFLSDEETPRGIASGPPVPAKSLRLVARSSGVRQSNVADADRRVERTRRNGHEDPGRLWHGPRHQPDPPDECREGPEAARHRGRCRGVRHGFGPCPGGHRRHRS